MFADKNLNGAAPKRRTRFFWLAMLAAFATVQIASISRASAEPGPTLPGVNLQGAGVYNFNVGSTQIAALSDGTVPGDTHQLLRDTTEQKTDGLLQKGSSPIQWKSRSTFLCLSSILGFTSWIPDRASFSPQASVVSCCKAWPRPACVLNRLGTSC
jgi:hypothetical protein